LPPGSLRLSDLAYFNLVSFEAMGSERYWISRLKVHVLVFEEDGRALDLAQYLAHTTSQQVDRLVLVGAERLSCRLVAQRVSSEVAAQRRRKLKETARRKGQPISQARLALADWTIFLTNVPLSMLSTEQVFLVAGVRWQVELVFKLWKSECHIDTSRSQNPWRILTELYAKLLGWLIHHWLTLSTKAQQADRSPTKTLHIGRQYALYFANTLADLDAFSQAITCFQRSITPYARINKSQKAPPTFQKLLQSTPRSLS
jgi:Transposase DDE domain